MERLPRINRQNSDGDRFWISRQNSGDELTEYEREEIDNAIALSLIEEDWKGKYFIDDIYQSNYEQASKAQLGEDELLAKALQESLNVEDELLAKALQESLNVEDELLAKALQESLNVEDPSKHSNENSLQLHPISSSGSRICAGCKNQIGHEDSQCCMGADWHPKCFRCHACGLPIADLRFSESGDNPYHESCYRANHHPRCYVCKDCLPLNKEGLEYKTHPSWMKMYCPSHERDGTPICCSCERMEPIDRSYLLLEDGRKLCLECRDSAVMNTHECQPLYLEIQRFFESMNMKVDQQIPLSLVARQALNEAMDGETDGHHHSHETIGLCVLEGRNVPNVAQRSRIGLGNQIADMVTEPYKSVNAILILDGLPRLLTGSGLAHEMMHAWLLLEGYPKLSPKVEEGLCQVLAHMWLNSEIYSSSTEEVSSSSLPSSSSSATTSKKGKWSDFEIQLGNFFKHQIETDISMAYGEGFRIGNEAVKKHGLRKTLDHIRLTGTYPL